MALTLASEKSVDYLKSLFVERFGSELPESEYKGLTQAQVSGKIKRLLAEEGVVPASEESQNDVIALATQLGITVIPGATQAAVNRQLRSLQRQANAAEYRKGAADFDAFLATLKPSTTLSAQVVDPVEDRAELEAMAADNIPF